MSEIPLHVTLQRPFNVSAYVILGEALADGSTPQLVIGANSRIRSHTVIYSGASIGKNFSSGHGVLIRELTSIGDDVSIGSGTVVEHRVTIGHRVRIHSQAFVPEFTTLEDDVWVGPRVVFTNAKYPKSAAAKSNLIGPFVEQGAKLGANCTLLPGIRIGRQALVGAGSVVTHDVPAWAVVAGNPAHIIGDVRKIHSYQETFDLLQEEQ